MKQSAVLSYILAVLEGGISGVCFYNAGKTEEPKRKVLWYITSAIWFVLSVLDSLAGSRALKEAGMASDGGSEPEQD